MGKYLYIFLFIFYFSIEKSWSHPEHNFQTYENAGAEQNHHNDSCEDCGHQNKINETEDKDVRAIVQLIHVLHHAIEGEEHIHSVKDFLRALRNKEQWAHLVNFNRIARRANRAFHLASDKDDLKNHAKNITLLWPISHFIEFATAPAFVAIGTIHGWPSIVVGAGGSFLSLIVIPGLDPLCFLLLSTYPLKPVHRSVDFVRRVTENSLRGIITTVKLDVLFSKTYSYEDRFHFIQQKLKSSRRLNRLLTFRVSDFEGGNRLSLFDSTGEDEILSVKRVWDAEENRFYVKSVWISQTAPPDILKRHFLRLLSWNARAAVREVMELQKKPQKIQSYEKEFFVDEIVVSENGVEVSYKDRAVYLSNKIRFRDVFRSFRRSSCKDSFL
ncbi:MAG: hypothetical protein OXK80_00060 [Bdellovibrionales bacterium]|nr:hypothetical protein [Bdellovibrionales bacterium]